MGRLRSKTVAFSAAPWGSAQFTLSAYMYIKNDGQRRPQKSHSVSYLKRHYVAKKLGASLPRANTVGRNERCTHECKSTYVS